MVAANMAVLKVTAGSLAAQCLVENLAIVSIGPLLSSGRTTFQHNIPNSEQPDDDLIVNCP